VCVCVLSRARAAVEIVCTLPGDYELEFYVLHVVKR
jgi:hypothetical protein